MDQALRDTIVSVVLGAATGFLVVQLLVFVSSIGISLIGLLKERVFNRKYFYVWLKSVAGIAACGIVFFLGDYIFSVKLGFSAAMLDPVVFGGVTLLVVIGFLFHIMSRLRKIKQYMETSEFDAILGTRQEGPGVEDYVRKNLELLQALQGMDKRR
ncbi:hypothetical protein [Megalodesulfovibrio gigas]|uniref:Uncharacterized protein n=1 Tax=Megalodesulfovibrio gigas (strain ATCC 19364 / DSM 1382 / NCIMB 9332 / VKM B-1759) TaxID=1121448 RepID=T2GBS8_MEGG1|nr:hypothetical protein [Megalodesulfovibrio gigas]AGW13561.1 hypothetical protein DGI_1749 [Megalodesulfovibrio gigas DSM 1382 = ATCC 19364]